MQLFKQDTTTTTHTQHTTLMLSLNNLINTIIIDEQSHTATLLLQYRIP